MLKTYEPRVDVEEIKTNPEAALFGEFSTLVSVQRKEEDEDKWLR